MYLLITFSEYSYNTLLHIANTSRKTCLIVKQNMIKSFLFIFFNLSLVFKV